MAKWSYQVLLAEIDAETEEDFSWYWPNSPSEARPEFASEQEALETGQRRYPGCQVKSVPLDVHMDAGTGSGTSLSSAPT
jgi:hypothetical protein